MCKPELAYRSDGPERGTRNEGLYMRSTGKRKTLGPFRRFVSLTVLFMAEINYFNSMQLLIGTFNSNSITLIKLSIFSGVIF